MKMLRLYRAKNNAMNMYVIEDTETGLYIVADWDLSEDEEKELIQQFEAGEINGEENGNSWESEDEAFGESFDREYIGLYAGKKTIGRYELTEVKAIAESAGDTEAQNALFIIEKADDFQPGDWQEWILYDYELTSFDTEEEIEDAIYHSNYATKSYEEDENGVYHT